MGGQGVLEDLHPRYSAWVSYKFKDTAPKLWACYG